MANISGRWERTTFTNLTTYRRTAQKALMIIWMVVLLVLPISFSFGSNGTSDTEASRNVAESAMDREMAELVKLYRMCLQKHEDNPMKAKENCGMYKEAIREFSPTSLRTIVTELLDGLRDNCKKSGNGRDKEL